MRTTHEKINEVLLNSEYAYIATCKHTNWVAARLYCDYPEWENLGAKDFAAAILDCAEQCDQAEDEENRSMVAAYIG